MPHRSIPLRARTRARSLRSNMTEAEKRNLVSPARTSARRNDILAAISVGAYVVDFICLEAQLIIEIDGGQHAESTHDKTRDAWLRSQNFIVLRFWNNDVLANTNGVIERIGRGVAPPLTLPRKGRE